jgi:hypothetical protein
VRVVALKRWEELNVARQRELRCDGGCGLGSLAGPADLSSQGIRR